MEKVALHVKKIAVVAAVAAVALSPLSLKHFSPKLSFAHAETQQKSGLTDEELLVEPPARREAVVKLGPGEEFKAGKLNVMFTLANWKEEGNRKTPEVSLYFLNDEKSPVSDFMLEKGQTKMVEIEGKVYSVTLEDANPDYQRATLKIQY